MYLKGLMEIDFGECLNATFVASILEFQMRTCNTVVTYGWYSRMHNGILEAWMANPIYWPLCNFYYWLYNYFRFCYWLITSKISDVSRSSQIIPLVKSIIEGSDKFSWPPFIMGSSIVAIILVMKHLVRDIPQRLPPFSIPKEFGQFKSLIPTAILITGVAILEYVGIAKVLVAKNGYELDSNQEKDMFTITVLFSLLVIWQAEIYIVTIEGELVISYTSGVSGFEATAVGNFDLWACLNVVWSIDLYRKFVASVNQLGIEKAVPKRNVDLMNVDGIIRENVASHL
ncbi:hypothetical protein L2E82_31710 [Cichorium intybus]|uniref:Uncharacterized protein n=1 Tax=Cichorium intybus TaxID=13427 RepID=A0ACB9BF76_CICIN|nr:hypothetical protein L2E82_31710 [Cichorium intybus]